MRPGPQWRETRPPGTAVGLLSSDLGRRGDAEAGTSLSSLFKLLTPSPLMPGFCPGLQDVGVGGAPRYPPWEVPNHFFFFFEETKSSPWGPVSQPCLLRGPGASGLSGSSAGSTPGLWARSPTPRKPAWTGSHCLFCSILYPVWKQ